MMNPFGMGWHLDRASFDQILRDTVESICPGRISLVKGAFIGIEKVDDGSYWSISMNSIASDERKVYHSKWVVDATGRKSSIARKV
jgi:flavin-dependent dehydrogenase